MRRWKEKITKERGYLHETNSSTEPDIQDSDATDSSKSNDFNYLLSMPLWNLTLEKKEEIIRQQKEKNQELNDIQLKTVEQLWLDDLDEFKTELDRNETQEKEEFELTVKKSLVKKEKSKTRASGFNVNSFLKRNSLPNSKYEYLPSSTGERVAPKIDAQLLEKCLKEAQQKEIVKLKKEEQDTELKSLSIVDVISSEKKNFNEQELKEIKELTEKISNPKAK